MKMRKAGSGNYLTAVQIDSHTREKLREVAARFGRSMTGQVRWLIEREYAHLNDLPFPSESDNGSNSGK